MRINWAMPFVIIASAVMLWLLLDKSNPSPSNPSSAAAVATPVHHPPKTSTGNQSHEPDHNEGINQEDNDFSSAPANDGQEKPDYTHSAADQQAALDVTSRFIAGWLDPDPHARRTTLEPIAAGDLVAQLSSPDIRVWQTVIQGPPTLTNQNSTTVTTQQAFSDGRAVAMLLLYDPAIESRWTVIDIQPVKEN